MLENLLPVLLLISIHVYRTLMPSSCVSELSSGDLDLDVEWSNPDSEECRLRSLRLLLGLVEEVECKSCLTLVFWLPRLYSGLLLEL